MLNTWKYVTRSPQTLLITWFGVTEQPKTIKNMLFLQLLRTDIAKVVSCLNFSFLEIPKRARSPKAQSQLAKAQSQLAKSPNTIRRAFDLLKSMTTKF